MMLPWHNFSDKRRLKAGELFLDLAHCHVLTLPVIGLNSDKMRSVILLSRSGTLADKENIPSSHL